MITIFFSDTQLCKFDSVLLEDFILQLKSIVKECNGSYRFDFELLSDSSNKKVYELELIAIYRKAS